MKKNTGFITLETSAPYTDETARIGWYAICDPCGFYLSTQFATREAAESECIDLDDRRHERWDWDRRPSGPSGSYEVALITAEGPRCDL